MSDPDDEERKNIGGYDGADLRAEGLAELHPEKGKEAEIIAPRGTEQDKRALRNLRKNK